MFNISLEKQLNGSDGLFKLAVDIALKPGLIYGLFGKTGEGKTSLLRMIAGFDNPDSGKVEVNHSIWFDSKSKTILPIQERKIGYVVQQDRLYPNMSVIENLEFAFRTNSNYAQIDDLLEKVGLFDLREVKVDRLSGGQQQRLVLIRSILSQPDLLLLDEPFSGLDPVMKKQVLVLLKELQQAYKFTVIIVSHDLFVMNMITDEVLLLEQGKIIAQGNTQEVLKKQMSDACENIIGKVISINGETVQLQIGDQVISVQATPNQLQNIALHCLATIDLKVIN